MPFSSRLTISHDQHPSSDFDSLALQVTGPMTCTQFAGKWSRGYRLPMLASGQTARRPAGQPRYGYASVATPLAAKVNLVAGHIMDVSIKYLKVAI